MSAARGAALALALVAACASPGIPPGGPPDDEPPRVVRIVPDTGAVNARPRAVVFAFDEVVSELPAGRGGGASASSGSTGLASIVIVSPRDGAPDVDWQRDRIVVRPRRGFRPNTTYTVTILPGLADIRSNVRDTAVVAFFSTGPTLDQGEVSGIVFDWVAGKPADRALVEAIAADSTTYVARADSVGRFTVSRLRPGPYLVRGIIDADNDGGLDRREAFDSVRVDSARVARRDTARVELLAFVHDTAGPRIVTVTVRDSVTLRVTFDQPLDPLQPLTAARYAVVARDSTSVPLAQIAPAALFDSLEAQRQRATADSVVRAARDSAARDTTARTRPPQVTPPARPDTAARARRDTVPPPPKPSRPSPSAELGIRLAAPLRPNALYRLVARDQQSISGVARTSERGFTTPRAAPGADSAAARPDSTRRRPAPAQPARPDSSPPLPPRPAAPPRRPRA